MSNVTPPPGPEFRNRSAARTGFRVPGVLADARSCDSCITTMA